MKLAELIKRAIEIGNKRGSITFDQLNELAESKLEPEDIEALFYALGAEGINVTEE